jgi:hypothetical protein
MISQPVYSNSLMAALVWATKLIRMNYHTRRPSGLQSAVGRSPEVQRVQDAAFVMLGDKPEQADYRHRKLPNWASQTTLCLKTPCLWRNE